MDKPREKARPERPIRSSFFTYKDGNIVVHIPSISEKGLEIGMDNQTKIGALIDLLLDIYEQAKSGTLLLPALNPELVFLDNEKPNALGNSISRKETIRGKVALEGYTDFLEQVLSEFLDIEAFMLKGVNIQNLPHPLCLWDNPSEEIDILEGVNDNLVLMNTELKSALESCKRQIKALERRLANIHGEMTRLRAKANTQPKKSKPSNSSSRLNGHDHKRSKSRNFRPNRDELLDLLRDILKP